MIIASIDPGLIHTGIALKRYCGNICYGIFLATFEGEKIFPIITKISRLASEVVIERMPSNLDYPLSMMVTRIRQNLRDAKITQISPGTWKPYCKARGLKNVSFAKTQHEKDAFLMLEYYLLFYRGRIKNEKFT